MSLIHRSPVCYCPSSCGAQSTSVSLESFRTLLLYRFTEQDKGKPYTLSVYNFIGDLLAI